ncbi:MAG: peptidoglycan-binding domain-containing protein [Pseudomonadota bacterium]
MKLRYLLPIASIIALPIGANANDLLPPNAKPGECYARVLQPASYTTAEKKIIKKEATEIIEQIPAKYEWAEQRVLVKEESESMKVIPAKYKTVEETVLVKPAAQKIVPVAATYKTVEEKVLVKPGYTTWKKGRGLIEKVDNATGELMCLVEVPPEYKIVKKRVIDTAPTTKVVEIPAEYKKVKKRVVAEAARVETTKIPAEYKVVKVRKLVSPASEKRTSVPAEYITVQEQTKTTDAVLAWRSVLCETNTTKDIVRRLQNALASAGHYKGPIDGIIGSATRTALTTYQDSKGLARGQMTLETLKSLGISI